MIKFKISKMRNRIKIIIKILCYIKLLIYKMLQKIKIIKMKNKVHSFNIKKKLVKKIFCLKSLKIHQMNIKNHLNYYYQISKNFNRKIYTYFKKINIKNNNNKKIIFLIMNNYKMIKAKKNIYYIYLRLKNRYRDSNNKWL